MESSNFGQSITYYREGDAEAHSNDLAGIVRENGFSGFSPEGISSYLTFRYPVGDLTMFKGYGKVPCGAEMENGRVKTKWYPKFGEKKVSFDEARGRVEELLVSSVKKLADGNRVAIPLSGGVDSSLILAICRKLYPDKEIHTYTAGFYGDDEFEYSRLAAREFNSVHREVVLHREDYIGEDSLLRPLIKQKAEPLHPNEIALASVEKLAKEDGCNIALCGEGSDDIFGGYGQNLRMYMNFQGGEFFRFFLDNYRYFSLEDGKALVKDKYLVDDYKLLMSAMSERGMPQDIRNRVFYFTQKIHTPGLIIRGANAMRFNKLKLGFPYIDMPLVEYANSLPFDFKVHWKSRGHEKKAEGMNFREVSEKMDIPKYISKKIAEKYLPRRIIYRPKYGFPVPFEKWFKGLKEWDLDEGIFKTRDISRLSGWKKFMVINLNTFIGEFSKYRA